MEKVTEINNQGVKYFLNNDISKAEKEFEDALKLDPENTTTLNNLGLLFHQKRQYDRAEDYFKKAISVNEKDTYYLNLANAQVFQKRNAEAENSYKKAILLNPKNESAIISLARFFETQKRISESARLWAELSNSSSNENYRVEWAKNKMALDSFEEALGLLGNVSQTEEVLRLIGVCEFNLKNYGLAEIAFKKGLGINPEDYNTRHYLAINHLSKGDYKSAIKEFDFLIRLNPNNEKLLLDKVSVLLNIQQKGDARELIEKVLEINPENRKALQYKEWLSSEEASTTQ